MCYFDNWSIGAWIYAVIHGSYGIMWVIKDLTFPDSSFAGTLSLGSLLSMYGLVLGPYYLIGYWVVSGGDEQKYPSNERIFVALMIYIFGLAFMLLTDAQKYLVLRERKGLITHGMMAWSRNMNYCGEIMIYSSFGILCQRIEVWFFFAFIWGMIFGSRMMMKDYSLSKKVEWPTYEKATWLLLPKIYKCWHLAVIVYGLAAAWSAYLYHKGGFEMTAKAWGLA